MLNYLITCQIIPNPKQRSNRWIATSVTTEESSSVAATMCSAEYHANNLRNPVRFYSALKRIPESSIVIEIAPSAALQVSCAFT